MGLTILATAAWLLLVFATPAYAYLDPGSGGMMVQLLLGGVAGVAVLCRMYWRRFLTRIGLSAPDGDREA
jgi:hypothetical protein